MEHPIAPLNARTLTLMRVLQRVGAIVSCQADACSGDEKSGIINLYLRIEQDPGFSFDEGAAVAARLREILDCKDPRERRRKVQRLASGLWDRVLGPGTHSIEQGWGTWLDDGPHVTMTISVRDSAREAE